MSYQPYYPQPFHAGYPPAYPQRSSAPFSVHVVAFFIYLGGSLVLLGGLAFGALAIGALNVPITEFPQRYRDLVTGIGVVGAVVLLFFALLYFLIARKLQRGRQWARVLVMIFCVLGLIGSALQIFGLVQMGAEPVVIGSAASSLIGPLLFLWLLNTSAARSWFRHRTY